MVFGRTVPSGVYLQTESAAAFIPRICESSFANPAITLHTYIDTFSVKNMNMSLPQGRIIQMDSEYF
jgi:hypothetical protein